MKEELTIFDFNPTEEELHEIGLYSSIGSYPFPSEGKITKELYLDRVKEHEQRIFDIGLLHEKRGLDASVFWEQIPFLYQQYKWGFDDIAIPEP